MKKIMNDGENTPNTGWSLETVKNYLLTNRTTKPPVIWDRTGVFLFIRFVHFDILFPKILMIIQ